MSRREERKGGWEGLSTVIFMFQMRGGRGRIGQRVRGASTAVLGTQLSCITN
jgi:hypothetical protein